MVFQTNMTCKKERRSPAVMNADVWPCLSQISFIFSPDAVHFGQKTFETGCKTYKVPFILGRSVNWWLPCGDHFSHQGGSCHQCPWGPRLQLPKPGNFHTVQTCCRCRLSAPESAGPFEATQAPKTSAARLGHQHPSQGETRPRPLRQCQETRVFRDPVDAKMSLPSQDTLPTTCKRAEFGVLQASNPTKQELLLIENVPQALSFKCLRQVPIKSNSRFVSIVLLNWRSVVLCRLNSALSLLFIFFRNMSRNQFTPPTLFSTARLQCPLCFEV